MNLIVIPKQIYFINVQLGKVEDVHCREHILGGIANSFLKYESVFTPLIKIAKLLASPEKN